MEKKVFTLFLPLPNTFLHPIHSIRLSRIVQNLPGLLKISQNERGTYVILVFATVGHAEKAQRQIIESGNMCGRYIMDAVLSADANVVKVKAPVSGWPMIEIYQSKTEECKMNKIVTCEQVSNGHPDKICDQISDAIVTECLKNDRSSRVAIETMIKDKHVIIAGELTSSYKPDYMKIVNDVFKRIGFEKLGYSIIDGLHVQTYVGQQSADIARGVDRKNPEEQGAGDQGMMYGYATNETLEMLPLPFALATRFLQKLRDYEGSLSHKLYADAKAQVSFDYDTHRIDTFLCSVHHSEDVTIEEIKAKVGDLMIETAQEYGLATDFKILVNPTGKFTVGGPFADSGLTGRKLACDTYGGIGHIGGGAMSGKDPSKVDRSGAYMARKIAKAIVKTGYADRCEVQIAYAIGIAKPVSVNIETFGTAHVDQGTIEKLVTEGFDLTPNGIIHDLKLLDVDYNQVSAYGHFGKADLPWEE
jgi:S-adenosylmethionine synthetase